MSCICYAIVGFLWLLLSNYTFLAVRTLFSWFESTTQTQVWAYQGDIDWAGGPGIPMAMSI